MSFAFFPLYTGDYLRDTQHLSLLEHGAYLKLLMYCWDQKGPAPNDERKLMGICNARSKEEISAVYAVLEEFFVLLDNEWYNKRMQIEIERSEAISKKRSVAALARHGLAAPVNKDYPSQRTRSARLSDARKIASHTDDEWNSLVEYHQGKCACCGSSETMMVKDHIIPLHKGGDDGIKNIQPLCYKCNHTKGGGDSTDYRKDGWYQHVLASADHVLASGTTPTPTPILSQPQSPQENTLSGKPDESHELLKFLNKVTGKNYRPVPANMKLITARLREYNLDELKAMVALKAQAWKYDGEWSQYLRPATLFNATKCAQYIAEVDHEN